MPAPRSISIILDGTDKLGTAPLWAWQSNQLTITAELAESLELLDDVATIYAEIHDSAAPAGSDPLAAVDVEATGDEWTFDFTTAEMGFDIGTTTEQSAMKYLFLTARDSGGDELQTLHAQRIEIKAASWSGVAPETPGRIYATQEEMEALFESSIVEDDTNLITEGDSRTGTGGGGLGLNEDWPAQLIQMSAFAGKVTLTNPGTGSAVVATAAARYATDVYPLRPAATGKPAILIIWLGGNDIDGGATAADTIAALDAYCTTAQTDGFDVWMCTDIPRDNFTYAEQVQFREFNRLLRHQTFWDRLIDLEEVGDPYDTTFMPDGLHQSAAGSTAIAAYINWHAFQSTQPMLHQSSGKWITRVTGEKGFFNGVSLGNRASTGGPLELVGSHSNTATISMYPDTGGADDTGISFFTYADEPTARNFMWRANFYGLGSMNLVQSPNTGDIPQVIRVNIDRDGNTGITEQLRLFTPGGGAGTPGAALSGFYTGWYAPTLAGNIMYKMPATAGTGGQVLGDPGGDKTLAWVGPVIGSQSALPATLSPGATTFAVTISRVMIITGDGGGNTIGTITGGTSGQMLVLIFVDANVTITDTEAATADTINLAGTATNFTSAANKTLTLIHNGTKWLETARSAN